MSVPNSFDVDAMSFSRDDEAEQRTLERRHAEDALTEAHRSRDVFLAVLAHELRNPLTALRFGVDMVQLSEGMPESAKRLLSMMGKQIEQLDQLIEDLLDINRIAQGKMALRVARADLQSALNLAVETSMPLFHEKEQKLTVNLPAQPVLIDADAARVTQMVSNLLSNACKCTRTAGNIWLSAEADGVDAVIRVRDDGAGIPADQLDRIFDLFAQVGSVSEVARRGQGIGLTLVKSLATMHAGSVEAVSAGPGQGSEFILRLPLQNMHAATEPA